MSRLIGKKIGKFEIVAKLGGGGMADVYKAFQPSLNRHVAIKVIHHHLAQEEQFLQRFHREAQNVASLRHPNIVQMYDFDVFEELPYMVMEFISGPSLGQQMRDRKANNKPWSLDETLGVIGDIGSALAFAHKQEMIHRDVKPANVMYDPGGRYILTDFGLAKMLSGPSYTATGTVMGTPAYMSPEQCQGSAGEAGSDIYSLGIVLYELATGQLPFDADTQLGFLLKHINEPPPPPNTINRDLPAWLTSAILKTLEKDVDERYQTLDALLDDIQANRSTIAVPSRPVQPTAPGASPAIQPTEVLSASQVTITDDPKAKTKRSRFAGLSRPKLKLPEIRVPGVTLNDLREKAESAVAAIEEQQDKLTARRLETTERIRKGLQSKLEQAVDRTTVAQRARFAIMAVAVDVPMDQPALARVVSLIKQRGGEVAEQGYNGVTALFELESDSTDVDKLAVDTGLNLAHETADSGSALYELRLRAGVHMGVLPTLELSGEAVEIAQAVAQAAPPGRLQVSHAAYSRVRHDYQFDKQPSIRQPGTDAPVQIYLVSPAEKPG
jgi:serine/threonine protein kinase